MKYLKQHMQLWLFAVLALSACQVSDPLGATDTESGTKPDSEWLARLGIDAVYLDDVYRYGAGGTLVLDYQPWILYANGFALQGIEEPLNDLDPDRHRAQHPERWYSWRMEGQGSQKEIVLVDHEGEEEILTESELFRAGPVPDDYRLAGIWSHVSGAGTDYGNSVTFESTVSFLDDGQFTFDRISASSSDGPVEVADLTADPSRRGHYRVDGFDLTLSFDDGEQVTLGFYSWLDDSEALDTAALGIGGETYLKE